MTKEILVADDQAGIRMLLQEMFTDEGYHVTTAETGKEALDRIYAGSFDLLMLDYKLPVVDGSQVLRQLDQDRIFIPVIIMSGLAEDVRKDVKQFSFIRKVFAKPFNIQEVSGFVKSVWD